MSDLLPKLKEITVHPNQLMLDPNNPRFRTHEDEEVPQKRFKDDDVRRKTDKEMNKKEHDVKSLEDSIRNNGWNPVDVIFVRKYAENEDGKFYFVIEGNRRLTAINNLLEDEENLIDEKIREALEELVVWEITDKINPRKKLESEAELQKKIDYLLGVRHHGSLHGWSPFAQATHMFEKYLDRSGQTWETFGWERTHGEQVGARLSTSPDDVKNRIMVFRAMRQIGETERVQNSEPQGGGIKDRYYSIVEAGIKADLDGYINFDSSTFLFDDESITRIIDLCYFDKKSRGLYPDSDERSPFNNPRQWKYFEKIIKEGNPEDLRRVEENKERPEDVWADRLKEMQNPEWGVWLEEVARIFKRLNFTIDVVSDRSKLLFSRLTQLLAQLKEVK